MSAIILEFTIFCIEEVAAKLEGIQCRGGTSCPDQLAKAIRAYPA